MIDSCIYLCMYDLMCMYYYFISPKGTYSMNGEKQKSPSRHLGSNPHLLSFLFRAKIFDLIPY
jgi:hypothetical protein